MHLRFALACVVLTKTYINRIFSGSIMTTDYDRICLKQQKFTVFRKCEYAYKASRTQKSRYTPANLGRRKRLTLHPFRLHTLNSKKRVSDFWHTRLLFHFRTNFPRSRAVNYSPVINLFHGWSVNAKLSIDFRYCTILAFEILRIDLPFKYRPLLFVNFLCFDSFLHQ